MGFAIYYSSIRTVTSNEAAAIEETVRELNRGRSWLSCEPVNLAHQPDGCLLGSSKPNFQPASVDAFEGEELPDGSLRDLLDALCALSRTHDVDWEIRHDYSEGLIGSVQNGTCDGELLDQIEALADAGMLLQDLAGDFDTSTGVTSPQSQAQPNLRNEDEVPPILKFRPKGS
jgi:hypothetical protein